MSVLTPLTALAFAGWLALGLCTGAVHFGALWLGTRLFASGARLWLAVLLLPGRFLVMLGVLFFAATQGGGPALIAAALGIALTRALVVRQVRGMEA